MLASIKGSIRRKPHSKYIVKSWKPSKDRSIRIVVSPAQAGTQSQTGGANVQHKGQLSSPQNTIEDSTMCRRRSSGDLTPVLRHFASSFAADDPPNKQLEAVLLGFPCTHHLGHFIPRPKWSLFKCLSTCRACLHPPSLAPTAQNLKWDLPNSSPRRNIRYTCVDVPP